MSNADTMVKAASKVLGKSNPGLLVAIEVSLAENGSSDPQKVSGPNSDGSYDYGLWQINSVHFDKFSQASLLTVDGNAHAMDVLSNHGKTWTAWATYNSGAYKVKGATKISGLIANNLDSFDMSTDIPFTDTSVSGAVNSIPGVSTVTGAASATMGAAKAIGSLTSHLLDPKWWLRIGQGLAAFILLIVALGLMFRKQIASGATAIATDGVSTMIPKGGTTNA
jgi:hypothetical protein